MSAKCQAFLWPLSTGSFVLFSSLDPVPHMFAGVFLPWNLVYCDISSITKLHSTLHIFFLLYASPKLHIKLLSWAAVLEITSLSSSFHWQSCQLSLSRMDINLEGIIRGSESFYGQGKWKPSIPCHILYQMSPIHLLSNGDGSHFYKVLGIMLFIKNITLIYCQLCYFDLQWVFQELKLLSIVLTSPSGSKGNWQPRYKEEKLDWFTLPLYKIHVFFPLFF